MKSRMERLTAGLLIALLASATNAEPSRHQEQAPAPFPPSGLHRAVPFEQRAQVRSGSSTVNVDRVANLATNTASSSPFPVSGRWGDVRYESRVHETDSAGVGDRCSAAAGSPGQLVGVALRLPILIPLLIPVGV